MQEIERADVREALASLDRLALAIDRAVVDREHLSSLRLHEAVIRNLLHDLTTNPKENA